jgi:hypothetical protein
MLGRYFCGKILNAEASTCDLWINQLTTKVHIVYIQKNCFIKQNQANLSQWLNKQLHYPSSSKHYQIFDKKMLLQN